MTDINPVQEAALANLKSVGKKFARRQKAFPEVTEERQTHPWTPELVDALTRPVRLELTFDDPMKVREQLEIIAKWSVMAQAVTRDHFRGIVNQRMDLHEIMRRCAMELVYKNGRTPTGQRKKRANVA